MNKEELTAERERLSNLFEKLRRAKGNEQRFEEFYNLIEFEYQQTGGEDAPHVPNSYNHNLEQTIDKQAKHYRAMKAKRPIKGAIVEFDEFISNFSSDVLHQLTRVKMQLENLE